MTTRKRPTSKTTDTSGTVQQALSNLQTTRVPLTSLQKDPRNSNKHGERNLKAIEASLLRFGAVEPLIVQRSSMRVIGGNGRLDRMLKLNKEGKWASEVDVIMLDVDDKTADQLGVALNRPAQLAELDEKRVMEILSEAQNSQQPIDAMGFTDAELNLMLDRHAKSFQQAQVLPVPSPLPTTSTSGPQIEMRINEGGVPVNKADLSGHRPVVATPFEGTEDYLPGVADLKDYVEFDSDIIFELPPLRADMLASCPEDIAVYTGPDEIGKATEIPSEYKLNIWGTYSMPDYSKAIIGFYVGDDKFAGSWEEPSTFAIKLLSRKPYAVIAPNYSPNGVTAEVIYTLFRTRWVARYWQECGLKIIPDIYLYWGKESYLSFAYEGIPQNPPCVAFQLQANATTEAGLKNQRRSIEFMLDRLKPQSILVYGDLTPQKRSDIIDGIVPDHVKIINVSDFTSIRMKYVSQRKKQNPESFGGAKSKGVPNNRLK
jgi:hypothetical protein